MEIINSGNKKSDQEFQKAQPGPLSSFIPDLPPLSCDKDPGRPFDHLAQTWEQCLKTLEEAHRRIKYYLDEIETYLD